MQKILFFVGARRNTAGLFTSKTADIAKYCCNIFFVLRKILIFGLTSGKKYDIVRWIS